MIDLGLRAGAYGDRSEHRLSLATLREHPTASTSGRCGRTWRRA